jgi:hypothetical protein
MVRPPKAQPFVPMAKNTLIRQIGDAERATEDEGRGRLGHQALIRIMTLCREPLTEEK